MLPNDIIKNTQHALAFGDKDSLKRELARLAAARGRQPIEKPYKLRPEIRLTESEMESISEQAAAAGMTLSEFCETVMARRATTYGHWL